MKSIILEGYDGGGKSSLGRYLSKKFSIPLFHAGPPADGPEHARLCAAYQLEWMRVRPVIWDRVTPISRLCYQETAWITERTQLVSLLRKMMEEAVIVYCAPKVEGDHETKAYDDQRHLEDIAKRRSKIILNYDGLMHGIEHIRYDYCHDTWYEIGEKIRASIS